MNKKPLAVIFDCDGVLVDSEVLALEVELSALAAIGLYYERADFCRRFMGMHNALFFKALDSDCRAATGQGLPRDFRERHRSDLFAACEARLAAVAHAHEAVNAARTARAVASSTGARFLEYKLKRTGLWEAFAPHVYSADLVANGKPAPDIYLHAAAALETDPAHCLAIEDSINGVASARAAGMRVMGFTGGGHCLDETAGLLRDAGAERVLADWREARALFETWN